MDAKTVLALVGLATAITSTTTHAATAAVIEGTVQDTAQGGVVQYTQRELNNHEMDQVTAGLEPVTFTTVSFTILASLPPSLFNAVVTCGTTGVCANLAIFGNRLLTLRGLLPASERTRQQGLSQRLVPAIGKLNTSGPPNIRPAPAPTPAPTSTSTPTPTTTSPQGGTAR